MRTSGFLKDIEGLLQCEKPLSVADFQSAWPGVPMPTVYSRIRMLLREGRISPSGRGQYQAVHKPRFNIPVSERMREVNHWMMDECAGVDYCLYEREANLIVEAFKSDLPAVMACMKRHFSKVIHQKDADSFPSILEGFIIVGLLVSEAPTMDDEDIPLPTLEKTLVDNLIIKPKDKSDYQFALQKAMEVYPVNVNRMIRYAARRGVKEELSAGLAALDSQRLAMFSAAQKYLASIPVLRAWVFGSFARGEETPASDLDLLIDYDHSVSISLLDIVRYKLELQKILGRDVDLVENGYLKPFAIPSAEKDKYLVYER